jgi:ferric-dicitrate binding protein FerR (iron transport regulator)
MAQKSDVPDINAKELRDLSALADGTLAPERRDEVSARIAASPELTALYERERHVVEMVQDANATVRAPAALRARIEAQRPKRSVAARRRVGYGGALATALAAAVLALVLALPGGTPGAPSVSQAAGLAALGAAMAPPAVDPQTPEKLQMNIEDVYFPNWSRQFGWRASGQRTDKLNGRSAVTVYYDWHGRRLAYTIVGAPALKTPAAQITVRNGEQYRTLTLHGRLVVTWRRDNHTCVLSGNGVDAAELQKLASWEGPAA